jgi:hypothetical protein
MHIYAYIDRKVPQIKRFSCWSTIFFITIYGTVGYVLSLSRFSSFEDLKWTPRRWRKKICRLWSDWWKATRRFSEAYESHDLFLVRYRHRDGVMLIALSADNQCNGLCDNDSIIG